jgi:hypothetical protein
VPLVVTHAKKLINNEGGPVARLHQGGTRALFYFHFNDKILVMKNAMSLPVATVCLFASVISLVLVMNLVDPSTAGVPGLLIILVLLYISFLMLCILLAKACVRLSRFFGATEKSGANTTRQQKRITYLSMVIAFAPLFFISLNSLGQIQIWYIVLILLFEGIAIFFIIRRT